jgi:hypothetical protein
MDADEAQAARRRAKREARRAAQAADAPAEAEAAPEEAQDAPAGGEAKSKRKEEKKRAREAAAAQAAGAATPAPSSKKAKAPHTSGAAPAATCAKVGDHELAASGARIKKSFYTECAELAALTTAVRGARGAHCMRARVRQQRTHDAGRCAGSGEHA